MSLEEFVIILQPLNTIITLMNVLFTLMFIAFGFKTSMSTSIYGIDFVFQHHYRPLATYRHFFSIQGVSND